MLPILNNIKEGYSDGYYNSKRYGMTKATFNNGKSIKFYAKELGGNDFISLNYYITSTREFLKPCEMTTHKVVHFLQNFKNH